LITVAAKKESQKLIEWDPKSRRNRVVPMSDESAQLLADLQLKAKEGFPYIFISPQRRVLSARLHEIILFCWYRQLWPASSA